MRTLKIFFRAIYILVNGAYLFEPNGRNFILCSYARNKNQAEEEIVSFLKNPDRWGEVNTCFYKGKVLYEV